MRRAEESYFELFRALARLSPEGAIAEADGLLLIASGKSLPFFNAAVATRPPADPAETLRRADDFFAARRLRYMFYFDAIGPIAEALGPLALAAGMEPHESTRMLLAPLIGQPRPVPGLEIRVVDDLASLRQYNATMTVGFGGDLDWAAAAMLQSDTLLRVPDLTHYLGLVGGEPVATAMRFSVSRIAHVANVSTIPAYRERGIGEAMTWAAALGGLEEGCIASYLQASEMGFAIYQRMGYRHVNTHKMWLSTG